jgi:hypothetical protein
VAVDRDLALRGYQYAANNADQRGLAGPVRSQQRKYLAAADVEIDAAERLEAGRIALRQAFDGNDRLHGGGIFESGQCRRHIGRSAPVRQPGPLRPKC